jgi:hypothetical protein
MDFNQKDTTAYRFKLIQEMLSCTSSEKFPTISSSFFDSQSSFSSILEEILNENPTPLKQVYKIVTTKFCLLTRWLPCVITLMLFWQIPVLSLCVNHYYLVVFFLLRIQLVFVVQLQCNFYFCLIFEMIYFFLMIFWIVM